MRDYFNKQSPIRFLFPIDGDCLNRKDGAEQGNELLVPVAVTAPEGHEILICGQKAEFREGAYRATVSVAAPQSTLSATDKTDGTACEITVFRLQNPMGGYRLSSDDNIIFLADINAHKEEYTSIFDNPYLAVYKKAHDLYGAKVHLNLFYEFDGISRSYFSGNREYFNLSMMTDKFREEFRANADWLKLSFHAKSEFPSEPYKHAEGSLIEAHAKQILAEIVRFAGPEVLSACTTVHFGEATEECVTVLREMGYKAMTGYFAPTGAPVAYYAPKELIDYVYHRDFWKDRATDVLFGRIDLVLNSKTHAANMETLKETVASPTRGGFVSIMIHEQYFYSDYKHYLSDFEQRVLEPCRYLAEQGYEGRSIQEVDGLGNLTVN